MYFTFEQVQEDNTLRDLINDAKNLDIEGKTTESVSNLVDALIEAQKAYAAGRTDTETVEMNLQNAIDNLEDAVIVEVNKTALSIAVEMANNVTKEDLDKVVPAVVTEFNAALQEAQTVLADANASQETVDASFARLSVAMHMLEFYKGNKSELQDLIAQVEQLDENNFTADSWQTLADALQAAKEVNDNENALQTDVDEAYDNLQAAINGLEEAEVVDKTFLEAMVNRVSGLNENDYIASTWNAMLPVLQEAKDVLADEGATQAQVDEAFDALTRAYLDLRLKPNKDLLAELINQANGLNGASYTAKTWSVMAGALEKATTVLNNPEATQKEVDNAKEALAKAIEGLAVNPGKTVDSSTAVKPGDTTASVKTGDVVNVFGTLGLASITGTIAYIAKKKKND